MTENVDRIEELRSMRNLLIVFFAVSIVVPIFGGPILLVALESSQASALNSYESAFVFTYEVITGADLTDATTVTNAGKAFVGIFALLNLVFFAFISSIIIAQLEIVILRKGIGSHRPTD